MSQLKPTVDKLLTGVSNMYVPKNYISESLLPFIGVTQKSGMLGKYGQDHLRIETSIAGGRGEFRRVEAITRLTSTFQIESHGLESMVTEDDYMNVDAPFEPEADETIGLTAQLWLEKEKVLADALANTSTLTQNETLSGTGQFSDAENSDPVAVFKRAHAAVIDGCGLDANVAFMDKKVYHQLRYHPQLLDMLGFKFAKPGGLTDKDLAVAMEVDKVMIADVSYNSAAEGQTAVLSRVWGKHLWFAVLPDSAQIRQVSLGYRLGLKGSAPRKIYKQPTFNPPNGTLILAKDDYSFHLSNVLAAYLVKNAIA